MSASPISNLLSQIITATSDANIEAFQIKGESIKATSAKISNSFTAAKIGFFGRIVNFILRRNNEVEAKKADEKNADKHLNRIIQENIINQATRESVYEACVNIVGKECANNAAKEVKLFRNLYDPLLSKHAAEFISKCHQEHFKITENNKEVYNKPSKLELNSADQAALIDEIKNSDSQSTPATSEANLPVEIQSAENLQSTAVADDQNFFTPKKLSSHHRQFSVSAAIATQNPTLTTTVPVQPSTVPVPSVAVLSEVNTQLAAAHAQFPQPDFEQLEEDEANYSGMPPLSSPIKGSIQSPPRAPAEENKPSTGTVSTVEYNNNIVEIFKTPTKTAKGRYIIDLAQESTHSPQYDKSYAGQNYTSENRTQNNI